MATKATRSAGRVQPRYGSVEDMAAYSGLSKVTIRRWIADGRLASHKAGARVLVEFAEFDRFIRGGAAQMTEPAGVS